MGNNNSSIKSSKSNKSSNLENDITSSTTLPNKPLKEQTDKCKMKKLLPNLENVKQEGDLNNIKSKYIFKIIFDYLKKGKAFKIIHYNKDLQNRLDISFKDFKEFYEIYSPIEIEIIPINRNNGVPFSYISIKENFRVYYNDNKKEVFNKYNICKDNKVDKIKLIIDYQQVTFKKLFACCNLIKSISFLKFTRINITDMSSMFFGCSSLEEINFYNYNTDNVTDMSNMFNRCKSLNKLDLTKFNTDKVTNMSNMFDSCSSLKELIISNFNTKNVENMYQMFYCCSSIKYIPINNFNTSNVKYMTEMFCDCKEIKDLDLSNFDTNKVENMKSMFLGCKKSLIKKIKKTYKNFEDAAFEEPEIGLDSELLI